MISGTSITDTMNRMDPEAELPDVPVLPRGHFLVPAEDLDEISGSGKTALGGNALHGIGAVPEQGFGMGQPAVGNIGQDGSAEFFPVFADKMIFADIASVCKTIQGELLSEMCPNVFPKLDELDAKVRTGCAGWRGAFSGFTDLNDGTDQIRKQAVGV